MLVKREDMSQIISCIKGVIFESAKERNKYDDLYWSNKIQLDLTYISPDDLTMITLIKDEMIKNTYDVWEW